MPRYTVLETIRKLDPEKDHQGIVFLSACHDFPFDTTRALEFALFRTFCVPRISTLLDRTGEFRDRAQKRYDDTDLIVSELMEWGYDSERGKRALRRMNQLHGRFAIANEDFLYVLSTFIYEPIRWNVRFGWRLMCEQERLGYFYFWREVGGRMNIREIPPQYDAFERFNRQYERQNYRFTPSNQRVGAATRELFVGWFPRFLSPLVRSTIYALLDEPVLAAFGFPKPSRPTRWIVEKALRLRAAVARFLPARRRPRLRTEIRHPSYPSGYVIEQLGPPGKS
ncbi:MAG TPA: oxygenase MpaB family protein [Candidatus Binatia bacterium]|nr:oxygenase MpaB family protein [Candidatus Binatia bacterium]